MTKLKTEINGQPFEIEIDDGLALEFSAGKLSVRRGEPSVVTYSIGNPKVDISNIDFAGALARARV